MPDPVTIEIRDAVLIVVCALAPVAFACACIAINAQQRYNRLLVANDALWRDLIRTRQGEVMALRLARRAIASHEFGSIPGTALKKDMDVTLKGEFDVLHASLIDRNHGVSTL